MSQELATARHCFQNNSQTKTLRVGTLLVEQTGSHQLWQVPNMPYDMLHR